MLPQIPGMSLGDVAGGLANDGPTSAKASTNLSGMTLGGISGNVYRTSPWLPVLLGLGVLAGLAWLSTRGK